jgi:gliding motility-associated-like protein
MKSIKNNSLHIRMKKLYLVLFAIIGLYLNTWAQPTFSIAAASGNYGNNEEVCMNVIVNDFTDILSFRYAITWDAQILELTSISGFNLAGLNLNSFEQGSAQNGVLEVAWQSPTGAGVTIPTRSLADNFSIYQLCFKTTNQCGGTTIVDINRASGNVRRVNVNVNIGLLDQDAEISVGGQPVTIEIGEVNANPEELVCVPITVKNFKEVLTTQFTMRWDTSVAQFSSIDYNPDFPFLNLSNFNTRRTADGFIILSWADINGAGIDLPDDTKFFDICFKVTSKGGVFTPIEFTANPTPIEIATVAEGERGCKFLNSGRIFVNNEPGAVTIQSSTQTVNPGEKVCVDITVKDFLAVTDMRFSISWDRNILRFEGVENINLRSLEQNDFNLSNIVSGILTLNWSDTTGVLLQNNTRIFSLCFTAVGPVGSFTPIAFTSEPVNVFVKTTLGGDQDAGLNTRNGTVSILPPESLNLKISNATVSPSERFCVDVLVDNFTEIVSLDYSMGWETTLIEFASITNFGVPGLGIEDFDLTRTNQGTLNLNWASETFRGETLTNGTVLYSVCFKAKDDAPLGFCNTIFFSDIPEPIRAITRNSNGNPIRVTDQGNDICIFDATGVAVIVNSPLQVSQDSLVCIPIEVRNFKDLTTLQFSLNWNPSIFKFESINPTGNLTGLTQGNFNLALSDIGVLGINWQDAANAGVTLADGTAIFELCLRAVGNRKACTRIDVSSSPNTFLVKSSETGDRNLSLNPLHGEICVADAIKVDFLFVVQPTCAESKNGAIEFSVSGGEGNYSYAWSNGSFSPTLNGISAGNYAFTITDAGGLSTDGVVNLVPANPSPIARAGADVNLSCGTSIALLDAGASSSGANFRYNWSVIGETGEVQVNGSINPLIFGAGLYQLEVTNTTTGCVARDTVQVTTTPNPIVNVGEDKVFDCSTNEIRLDATAGTERGENLTYLWRTPDGVIVGDTTSLVITATAPGLYVLRVRHSEGCESRDTVIIADQRGNVLADAGISQTLNCSGDPVTLDASRSSQGENFTANWSVVEVGGIAPTPSSGFVVQAFNPGTYVLTVTNTLTSCTATDTVRVIPDEQLPVIAVDFIEQLNCVTDSVQLNIRVSNTNTFNVRWFRNGTPLASPIDTMLTPIVTQPGNYEVIITNTRSGCTASRGDIIVEETRSFPTATISGQKIIGCADTSKVVLSAMGSSIGTGFVLNWLSADQANPIVSFENNVAEVFNPGTYFLRITDISTNCSALDSIVITRTTDTPVIEFAPVAPVPCTGGTTTIDASRSSLGTYNWLIVEGTGNIVQGTNTDMITVDGPGLYVLRIVNNLGCFVSDTIRVTQTDTTSIRISLEASTANLNCITPTSEVRLSVEPTGNYTYAWIHDERNRLPITTSSAELDVPGLYVIEVTETNLNCTRREFFVLNKDVEVTKPIINTALNRTVDCIGTPISLDGSATQLVNTETPRWVGPMGANIANANNLLATTTTAGDYKLIINNSRNGCQDSTLIIIESASDVVATIREPEVLTCERESILLNGAASSQGQNITYEWSSTEGNDFTVDISRQSAIITKAGTYTLTVRNSATQCDANFSVVVKADQEAPSVDAGNEIDLGCGGNLTIGGTGTATGTQFRYEWRDATGNIIQNNAAQTSVNAPGTYRLTVINVTNGCTATDEVVVTQRLQLERARAGSDEVTCDRESVLTANRPTNATGIWTSRSGGVIELNNSAETNVRNLRPGNNIFVWTLSTAECPSYSSDSINLFVELSPTANNDVVDFSIGKDNEISIKVTANDNLVNVQNWNLTISEKPSIGEITGFDLNTVRYTARTIKNEQDRFNYILCNANCPTLCDSATVSINIIAPDRGNNPLLSDLPNAITPNGDGKNDELFFEILAQGTEQFPDNEIIIFSRWGDIIYEAAPYENNWNGVNKQGKELPHGTYYYILRLDVANGIILVGDITILK